MNFPATHLPSWLQRAMRSPCPTTLEFPDSGYVTVFPLEQLYATNIADAECFSRLTSDTAPFRLLLEAPEEREVQPLTQLHWTLMLQRLHSQPQDYGFEYSVIRLQSWPSLAYLPQEILPSVARICALLAHKPTTASLIPLTLGLPQAQVFALLEVLRLNGHVQAQGLTPSELVQRDADAQELANASQPEPSAQPSFVAKLWQRLAGRN